MGTVAGHPLSTFTTPVNGSSPIDANEVRGNDNSIGTSYNAHDADATIHLQNGAVASRPAAATSGMGAMWLATDTGAIYLWYDTGSAWVEANYLRNTGGTVTGAVTITSSSANALVVGPNGTTNPTFNVDASTASAATGLNVKGAAAAAGVAVSVLSSGVNENLTIDAKGSGSITIGGTSTGNVKLGTGVTVTQAGAVSGVTTFGLNDTITSTKVGQVFVASGASTSAKYIQLTNTGGDAAFLIESSVGGSITGSVAYAAALYTVGATTLELGTNAAVRLAISSAGAFDFKTNSVTGITTLVTSGAITAGAAYKPKRVSPTYGATVTIDASLGNMFVVTITDANNFTMAAPTNPTDGQIIVIVLRNTSAGSSGTITWPTTAGAWGTSSVISSVGSGNSSTVVFYYVADANKWLYVAAPLGWVGI